MAADLRNEEAVVAELGDVAVLHLQRHRRQERLIAVALHGVVRAVEDVDVELALGVLLERVNERLPLQQAGLAGADKYANLLWLGHAELPPPRSGGVLPGMGAAGASGARGSYYWQPAR